MKKRKNLCQKTSCHSVGYWILRMVNFRFCTLYRLPSFFFFLNSLTCIHPLQYNFFLSLFHPPSLSLIHISKVKYEEKKKKKKRGKKKRKKKRHSLPSYFCLFGQSTFSCADCMYFTWILFLNFCILQYFLYYTIVVMLKQFFFSGKRNANCNTTFPPPAWLHRQQAICFLCSLCFLYNLLLQKCIFAMHFRQHIFFFAFLCTFYPSFFFLL